MRRTLVADDAIEIKMVCGPAELCTPGPHYRGTRLADGLLVEPLGDARPWFFDRD